MTSQKSVLQNMDTTPGTRFIKSDNKYGLIGMDHFALPTLNIDLMAEFIQEVLGGVPYYVAGYDEVDQSMGRRKHIFMRVGNVLMQCAEPQDGKIKIGKEDLNGWPHWAFIVTAEDMENNVERLQSLGIPVFGPVQHRGVEAVSAYFASPEGHKLEIVTYDTYPDEKTIGVAGAPGVGHTDWEKLFHNWPNN